MNIWEYEGHPSCPLHLHICSNSMIYENIIVLCFPQIPNFNIPQNNHFTMRFGDCWLFELNCNNLFAIAPLCSTKRVLICIQNYKEFVVGLECIDKYLRKATTSGALGQRFCSFENLPNSCHDIVHLDLLPNKPTMSPSLVLKVEEGLISPQFFKFATIFVIIQARLIQFLKTL